MNYLLVFVALALIGVLMLLLLGLRRRERADRPPGQDQLAPRSAEGRSFLDEQLAPPLPNLPPVLLPEHPSAGDVAKVRFSLGLRGYRMDQVDQVLDALAAELEIRGERIADLEAELKAQETAGSSGNGQPGAESRDE